VESGECGVAIRSLTFAICDHCSSGDEPNSKHKQKTEVSKEEMSLRGAQPIRPCPPPLPRAILHEPCTHEVFTPWMH
jgi:hypothetical protein